MADSFFDVFFEISDGLGFRAYNRTPIRVATQIDCLPPDGLYAHITGCTPLFSTPDPTSGVFVGNLVSANHFTYPACCFGGTCEKNVPTQICEERQGRVVPDCLGDGNNNQIDDACEQGACCLPQTCATGGVCGQFETCGGGAVPCLCLTVAEGGGNCARNYFCADHPLCPNGTVDCPSGQVCYVNTCCVEPTCGPAGCVTSSTAAPIDPNAGPTASGGQHAVSGEIPVPTPGCIVTDRIRCSELGGTYEGNATVCTPESCAPPVVEVDFFPNTTAVMELQFPGGSVPIALSGPTTVHVFFEGANEGDADDDDGDGRDDVGTEMVDMQLTGDSPFGPVLVRLHPSKPSRGQIEETANTQPGRLDLPPFAPDGTADSFFDVFFEIRVGDRVLHTQTPKRMSSVITHKPPAPGNTYENPEKIELLDENGISTGLFIGAGRHVPRPPLECGSAGTGDCFTPHDTPFCDRRECCALVCSLVPECCANRWNQLCAGLARDVCESAQACCTPSGSCKDAAPAVCELGGGTPQGEKSTCENTPCPRAGDCNQDGHVDLRDIAIFQNCFTGSDGGPARSECRCADLDNDGDIDLGDWKILRVLMTGP